VDFGSFSLNGAAGVSGRDAEVDAAVVTPAVVFTALSSFAFISASSGGFSFAACCLVALAASSFF
jgi:hypothetical protein